MKAAASLVILVAIAAVSLPASATVKLEKSVFDGGGRRMARANRALNGSVSQVAVGSSAGARVLRHGYWGEGGVQVVGVEDNDPAHSPGRPERLAFGPAWPNPSRGVSTFALDLPAEARVELTVFDVAGRVVSTLPPTVLAPGRQSLRWTAQGAGAQPLEAGVYFARLAVDGRTVGVRRVVLMH